MGKEILTSGNIEIEKNKCYHHKTPIILGDIDIEKVLVSKTISFGEKKTINTLLVTCAIIIKLSHYIYCFLKQALV